MFSFPKWPSMGKTKERSAPPIVIPPPSEPKAEPTGPYITILIVGTQGAGPPERKVPYQPGFSLLQYFRLESLVSLAMRQAVYDLSLTDRGRCRLYHVPQAGTTIRIGPPTLGIQGHRQQTGQPKQDIMEVQLGYRPTLKENPEPLDTFHDVEQI